MTQNFANAGIYLIHVFMGLYLLTILLRFLMQASRADFYNPICQAIVKITDPVTRPLKSIIPTVRGVDFATLIVAIFIQLLIIMLIMTLRGGPFFHLAYLPWTLLGLVSQILDIYFFALLILVVVSWVAPYSTHPAVSLIHQITAPLCTPARKLLPPMGGMDFSIILVFVFITLVDNYLVVKPLAAYLGVHPGVILGL